VPTLQFVPDFLAQSRCRCSALRIRLGGDMVAIKRGQRTISSKPERAEPERAEDACSIATITRLIHHLYGSNGFCWTLRERRDTELIKWSEVVGAVRDKSELT
jgi:hypothetical protein